MYAQKPPINAYADVSNWSCECLRAEKAKHSLLDNVIDRYPKISCAGPYILMLKKEDHPELGIRLV